MEDKKKKPFKETRVGLFLEKISNTKVAKALPELITGDVLGVVKELLRDDETLTPEQREYALKLIELDIKDSEAVTSRWVADMQSDSWLSKNVRPMTLVFLTSFMAITLLIDSFDSGFVVRDSWVELLETLLLTVFTAYFAGRSFEKTRRL